MKEIKFDKIEEIDDKEALKKVVEDYIHKQSEEEFKKK